jgi:two-component system, OmpR family, phosphate regulon sensor histidine kinase PhoR
VRNRDELMAQWRRQVKELPSARHLDTPTLIDHVPRFICELAAQLRAGINESIAESIEEAQGPADHGLQRVEDGFDIVEVVAEYNILRECIHDLAARNGVIIQGDMFRVINRLLDTAIGSSVQNYATAQALEVQRRREEHLAFIAHDLRTPLNAISMAAKLLEQAGESSKNMDRAVLQKTLCRNIDQLSTLVDDVLKENANVVTEIGVKLECRWFDLWPFVERLIYELRPIAATGSTSLVNKVAPDLRIYADASLMVRVFQNLISNAIRYTPGGRVEIGANEFLDGGKVELWVTDNGSGIPPEKLDFVFDKFETERAGERGAGLGLAIVKAFVEAHGGLVSVASEVNAGTTFRVTLPLGRPR